MNPLDYLLPRPSFDSSPRQHEEFDALLNSTARAGWVDYQLTYPKWQFLSHLGKSRNLVLHGSQNMEIEVVQPRQATDVRAFSGQNAIYATTDGIWAIFFAILDRKNVQPFSLFNSCLDIRFSPDKVLGPLYFFSITHSALLQKPWCDGAVYILPREVFEQERAQTMTGVEIVFPHWISLEPVTPIARVAVRPQDFPFLANVHGHDDEKLARLAAADPNGYPWPEALVI